MVVPGPRLWSLWSSRATPTYLLIKFFDIYALEYTSLVSKLHTSSSRFNMPLQISQLFHELQNRPALESLSYEQLSRFFRFLSRLAPEIALQGNPIPLNLPPHILTFLSSIIGLPDLALNTLWDCLSISDKAYLLAGKVDTLQDEDEIFRIHAPNNNLGM